MRRKFRVYDKPPFSDRFTIAIREPKSNTVHFWGCGIDPAWLSSYCGSSADNYRCGTHLGKKVRNLDDLPEKVQTWIKHLVKEQGYIEKPVLT